MHDSDNSNNDKWDMDASAHTTQHDALYATARPTLAPAGIPAPLRCLRCPTAWRDELARTAQRLLPREACWLLGGAVETGGWQLRAVLPLPNTAAGRGRFAVTAFDFARGEHDLRQRGLQLLGFAHSHPDGSASLSAADRRELWHGYLHLVVGMRPDRPAEFAAFWLRADGIETLSLEYSLP